MSIRVIFACTMLAGLAAPAHAQSTAAPRQADALLPPTGVVYLYVPQLGQVIENALHHPLSAKIQELPDVAKALRGPEVGFVKVAIQALEDDLGQPVLEALKTITSEGAHVCLDAESPGGVAALLRSPDEQSLKKVMDAVLQRFRETPRSPADFVKRVSYRDLDAYRIGDVRLVQLGPWLLVANHSDLGKSIIDRFLDGGDSLRDNSRFRDAAKERPDHLTAWAFVDVDRIRSSGVAEELFQGKTDNPGAELLVGGLMSHLQHTPWASASVETSASQLRVTVSSPHDPAWMDASRQFYFGENSQGQAPPLLEPEGAILAVSAYRDIGDMWLRAGDLFDQNVSDQLAQADNTFTTLFSGKDFGEDVLGALGSPLQLVVARQSFDGVTPRPAIKLPEFAMRFELLEGPKVYDDFRRTLQSLLGFLNVSGAQNGNPQLDFETQRANGSQILRSYYIPEPDQQDSTDAPIVFNFSPTAWFAEGRMTLSSTERLAKRLPAPSQVQPAKSAANTRLRLFAGPLRQALEDNLSQLAAQNMIEKGVSREEAETELRTLLQVISWFADVEANLGVASRRLNLEASVRLAE